MSNLTQPILSEIRAFSSFGAGAAQDVVPSNSINVDRGTAPTGKTPSFADTMSRMMDGVSGAQNTSGALAHAFEQGDPSADLARVMVSMQQAQVAFRATVEVRNRAVQAFQEVMNMPI